MDYKKAIPGAAAVAAADFGGSYVPAAVNVGGLPVASGLAAVAGAYLGEKLSGGGASLKRAAIQGLLALAAAEIVDCAVGAKIAGGAYARYVRIVTGAATTAFLPLAS